MKYLIIAVLSLVIPVAVLAGDNGYRVVYDGGSLPDVKTGTELKMYIETNQIRFKRDKTTVVTIPASAITEISYGQDVHRRVGTAVGVAMVSFGIGLLVVLSKSKKHYVGLVWADGAKKGGFAMQCDKNEYRGILAALEGSTGKKAVDSESDERVRKQSRSSR